ncbi:MAG: IclR family transcriptional regulator [Rhodoplanes sp.]|uniref:IclR family transcriptional regulator n=1 Tax=Rhodoplanes sp. TaxID=1968906 RepID=UPI001832EC13|nr:IclR family transcriptional regulator [Rhodoplanes sp.]NVO15271.1 IclR family transcriptional regulator [Rhodoplanes sp.]
MTVLDALQDAPQGLSLGAIASHTSLARSTVQRLVAALERERLVVPVGSGTGVRLGPGWLHLAASMPAAIPANAREVLVALSEELQETVVVAMVCGRRLLVVDQIPGNQRLQVVSSIGESLPLCCTANGKAYLAELPDAAVNSCIGSAFERRDRRTVKPLAALLDELTAVRRTGFALDREENTIGVCAVGIALPLPRGGYATISVPVPAARVSRLKNPISGSLLEAKQFLIASLGRAGVE